MSKCISATKRERVFLKYDGKCAYCGCRLNQDTFHIDHIIPKSRKGKNDFENLNPSCPTCNSCKGTFLIEDWRKSIENRIDSALDKSTDLKILFKFKQIEPTFNPVIFYFEKNGSR